MPWYHFHQNNSGGYWDQRPERGIGPDVWVEARDVDDANRRAVDIGIYFDGCDRGQDCDCCGDRWSRAYAFGGTDVGDSFEDMADGYSAPSEDKPVFLHPISGPFVTITHTDPHQPEDVKRLVEARSYEHDEEFVRQWIAKNGVPSPSA